MDNRLENLKFWCQKVIPLVYEDSLSYYELLCKVVKYINDLIDNQNNVNNILTQYGTDINNLKKDVLYLETELERVKNGDYVSLYIDSLSKWIDENLQELVARIAKFVWFGLDDDGYFIAVIPSSWNEVTFSSTEDGHLVLEV